MPVHFEIYFNIAVLSGPLVDIGRAIGRTISSLESLNEVFTEGLIRLAAVNGQIDIATMDQLPIPLESDGDTEMACPDHVEIKRYEPEFTSRMIATEPST